jgi:hypothetical protein
VWAAETHLDMLGTAFAVQATSQRYLDSVEQVLQPFLLDRRTGVPARRRYGMADGSMVRGGAGPGQIVAFRDCRRLGPSGTLPEALARLVAGLNRAAIDHYEGFAVHAGVVAIDGSAIAFPLDSGGGKSTLTAACLERGFGYVSDESLCVDVDTAAIQPYPKPLALSRHSLDLIGVDHDSDGDGLDETLISPQELGAFTVSAPLPLRHVVLAEFGHDTTTIEELAPSTAMHSLLALSFNHYKHGERAFHLAAALAGDARVWRLRYDRPREAALALERAIS